MTSTPAGGVNVKASAGIAGSRRTSWNVSSVVWPEPIDELHAAELPVGERQPDAAERRILGLRIEREHVDIPPDVERLHPKALLCRPIGGQQRRGGRSEGGVHVADRDLRELRVVDPDPLSIPDDELRRVRVVEPEASRTVDQHRAGSLLQQIATLVEESLLELRRHRVETGKVGIEPTGRVGQHGGAGQREHPGSDEPAGTRPHDGCPCATGMVSGRPRASSRRIPPADQSAGGGGGARTSRLPFDCNGPTTPACSISSSIRAARLYPILSRRCTPEIDARRVSVTIPTAWS